MLAPHLAPVALTTSTLVRLGRITNRTVSKIMSGQADPFVAQCKMPG